MRHAVSGRKFDRNTAMRLSMFRNLQISLIAHEHIETTEAKAKEIQGMVEQLVKIAREDTPHNRSLATSRLANTAAVEKLFQVIGPRFVDRAGGCTRIFKLGSRLGDGAQKARIEFLPE